MIFMSVCDQNFEELYLSVYVKDLIGSLYFFTGGVKLLSVGMILVCFSLCGIYVVTWVGYGYWVVL